MQTGDLPGPLILCKSVCLWCLSAHSGPPLAASQGNSRARTLLARFQRLSLALSYLVLARRPALALVSFSGLWFSLFPLVKGKHSKPSKETP